MKRDRKRQGSHECSENPNRCSMLLPLHASALWLTVSSRAARGSNDLAARLRAITDESPTDDVAHRGVTLADWNWFQSEVNLYRSMANALREGASRFAPGLAEEFASLEAAARDAQSIIETLLERRTR